jgi:hypothetical protein
MELPPDLQSLSDTDLDRLISELTKTEKQISRERRLLHQYLDVVGVDRLAQTTGVPLDGWVGKLAARENEVSYERSLVQGHLDILRAVRKERKRGGSRASLGTETLVKALLRHGGRSVRRLDSSPTSP